MYKMNSIYEYRSKQKNVKYMCICWNVH